jgi:hypothetical protein
MQRSPWQIHGHTARLQTEHFQAVVDLLNPGRGVSVTHVADTATEGMALFHVGIPPLSGGDAATDFFARGDDLVATYAETPERPLRAQAYWRWLPSARVEASAFAAASASVQAGADAIRPIAAMELILSVQTNLLDSDPTLTVSTTLPAAEISRLIDPESQRFLKLDPHGMLEPRGAAPTTLDRTSGTGCFVFRLEQSRLSYIEIVHPADFYRAQIDASGAAPSAIRISHRLFAERLEKGVILRSRIRGILMPQDHEPAFAARAYREFASAEPPLTA